MRIVLSYILARIGVDSPYPYLIGRALYTYLSTLLAYLKYSL